MPDGPKIIIGFETTGADESVADVKKVQQAEKDLSLQEQSLQEQADARTKGRTFDQPVFVDPDKAEAASRRAAAAASNAAAAEEAAGVRAERAAAKRSEAFSADAKMREQAASRSIAAAEQEAAAEEAALLRQEEVVAHHGLMMAGVVNRHELSLANAAGRSAGVGSLTSNVVAAAPYLAIADAVGEIAVETGKAQEEWLTLMDEVDKTGPKVTHDGEEMRKSIKEVMDSSAGMVENFFSRAWQMVRHPIDFAREMSGLQGTFDAIRESDKTAQENKLKYQQEIEARNQTRLATEKRILHEGIEDENLKLKEQEDTITRIISLRNKMSSLAVDSAEEDVRSAQLNGGDVELAKVNAMAAKLQSGLDALEAPLLSAQQKVENATQKAKDLEKEAANEEDFDKRSNLLRKVGEAWDLVKEADQDLAAQKTIFVAAKDNLVKKTGNDLVELQNSFNDAESDQAYKALKDVNNSLKEALVKPVSDTISQINADTATIVTAANTKATEVQTGIQTAATGTDTAITGIGTTAASTSAETNTAVNAAGSQVTEALNAVGAQVVTALGQITAVCGAIKGQVEAQQQQINTLFARSR